MTNALSCILFLFINIVSGFAQAGFDAAFSAGSDTLTAAMYITLEYESFCSIV